MVNGADGMDTPLVAEPAEVEHKLEPVFAIIQRHQEEEGHALGQHQDQEVVILTHAQVCIFQYIN